MLPIGPSRGLAGVRISNVGWYESFRLDVRRSDYLAPLVDVFCDELAEVGGRAGEHHTARLGKPRFHVGVGECRVDLLVELVDDLIGRVLRRGDSEPLS